MEILALKLLLNEEIINRQMTANLPKDVPIEDLKIKIVPEGVRITGAYPTVFMKVAFDTLWSITVAKGLAELRLLDLKVSGFPATLLRGGIFVALREATAKEPGISVRDEVLYLDPDAFLVDKGHPLKVNLSNVVCSLGSMIVESNAVQ